MSIDHVCCEQNQLYVRLFERRHSSGHDILIKDTLLSLIWLKIFTSWPYIDQKCKPSNPDVGAANNNHYVLATSSYNQEHNSKSYFWCNNYNFEDSQWWRYKNNKQKQHGHQRGLHFFFILDLLLVYWNHQRCQIIYHFLFFLFLCMI